MPFYATHHIFAATVQRITNDSAAHIAESYPAGYRWGAQGPDALYYYHTPFSSALSRLARRMHSESPALLFEALCEAAIQQHDTAALAYVFGFCTHYALDRVTHPFLRAQTEQLALYMSGYSTEARLKLVENDIDGIMIANFMAANPSNFEAYALLDPNAAECTVLARVLSAAAKSAYKAPISPAAVYRSLHDMRRLLHLAHSGSHIRNHLLRFEKLTGRNGLASAFLRPAQPLAADCANRSHRNWGTNDSPRCDSFFDLFDAAIPLAVSLQRAVLDRYYQEKPLDPRFFPTNFYGCAINN